MERDPERLLEALESGDSDAVNDAIDAVDDADFEESADLFESCFGECRALYEEGDGYQRQSVVRFLEALNPRGMLGKVVPMDEVDHDRPLADQVEYDLGYSDRLAEFYLTTIQDDDGRVRNSTKKAIKDLCIWYDMYGDRAPIEVLADELRTLADEHDGKKGDHVREALELVEHRLDPASPNLGSALARLASEAADREE